MVCDRRILQRGWLPQAAASARIDKLFRYSFLCPVVQQNETVDGALAFFSQHVASGLWKTHALQAALLAHSP
jgi:hypothetical protein